MIVVTIAYVLILISIAGYCNGEMDWIKFKNLDSESWKNKWFKKPDKSMEGYGYVLEEIHKSPWYYFGFYTPKFREKFMYSSTILVFITDKWHAFKWLTFFYYEIIISSLVVYYEGLAWWWIFVGVFILKTVRGLGFTLKYDKK